MMGEHLESSVSRPGSGGDMGPVGVAAGALTSQNAAGALTSQHAAGNRRVVWLFVAATICSCAAMATGFWFGTRSSASVQLPAVLAATAAASDTMAVATGPISDDAEGIFFLDFLTGDLQCLVYYPRARTFGAHFFGNVLPQLGGAGRNSKYLMVTGQAVTTAITGNRRPGASLVYITDVNNGMFAAYAVPWDRTAESTNRAQSGPLVYVGGGPVRNYQLRDPARKKPAGIVDPNKRK